ncbi:MAG: hypothetical protein WCA44_08575 [Acidobacteriaceae bacterium]
MALRFHDKDDDVDKEVEVSKMGLGCFSLGIVLVGAFWLAWDVFIRGDQIDFAFKSYAIGCALIILVAFTLERRVSPKYREFRIRTKEVFGTVIEIEKAISAVKEDQRELLERLRAIEEELHLLKFEK